MAAFEKVRKPPPGRAAASARSPTAIAVRRGDRSLRHAVPEGPGDRQRHLQERPALLRLRRLRRGDQALRPDRQRIPTIPTPAPRATRSWTRWQGQGLREHRDLGAAPEEDQGLPVEDEQARLDKLIVGAVMKSGEKYAAPGKYDQAPPILHARAQGVSRATTTRPRR